MQKQATAEEYPNWIETAHSLETGGGWEGANSDRDNIRTENGHKLPLHMITLNRNQNIRLINPFPVEITNGTSGHVTMDLNYCDIFEFFR